MPHPRRSNAPGFFDIEDIFRDLRSGSFDPLGGITDFLEQTFLGDPKVIKEEEGPTFGEQTTSIVEEGGRQESDVVGRAGEFFKDLGVDIDRLFEGFRGRVDRELPLRPFSDEQLEQNKNFIFSEINDEFNSLGRQLGNTLSVRGLRGSGAQQFGNLQSGRFSAIGGAGTSLLNEQTRVNQAAAVSRAGVFGDLDRTQSAIEFALGIRRGDVGLGELDIISDITEGRLAGLNIDEIFRRVDEQTKESRQGEFSDVIQAILEAALGDADFARASTFAFQ